MGRTFINRNWDYTEEEDLRKNIMPMLTGSLQAVPAYSENNQMVGWFIQSRIGDSVYYGV